MSSQLVGLADHPYSHFRAIVHGRDHVHTADAFDLDESLTCAVAQSAGVHLHLEAKPNHKAQEADQDVRLYAVIGVVEDRAHNLLFDVESVPLLSSL